MCDEWLFNLLIVHCIIHVCVVCFVVVVDDVYNTQLTCASQNVHSSVCVCVVVVTH